MLSQCRKCKEEKQKLRSHHYGKFQDESGKLWNGRTCPQCYKAQVKAWNFKRDLRAATARRPYVKEQAGHQFQGPRSLRDKLIHSIGTSTTPTTKNSTTAKRRSSVDSKPIRKNTFVTLSPCLICGTSPSDLDHISTQGAGGPDEDWNLWPLCRQHHRERHAVGIITFITRHPYLDVELKTRGWEAVNGKLHHPKKRDQDPGL